VQLTAIELDSVKPQRVQLPDVTPVVQFLLLMLTTGAAVLIPAHCGSSSMPGLHQLRHVWEAVRVDDGVALGVVLRAIDTEAAAFPPFIYPHARVADFREAADGLPADAPVFGGDGVDDAGD
jgi:hypothetical protein